MGEPDSSVSFKIVVVFLELWGTEFSIMSPEVQMLVPSEGLTLGEAEAPGELRSVIK